jgi:hypothetical protein
VSTRGRERGNGISRMIRFKNRLGWLSSRSVGEDLKNLAHSGSPIQT